MAIYHLHVKVIGRKAGSSAVASAAYRSASRLRDERLDRSQVSSKKDSKPKTALKDSKVYRKA